MAQRERYAAPHWSESADKLAPFSRRSLRAAGTPWLVIKNLGRDERGHWVRCPTTSTTIYGHQFDEGAAQPRRNNLSGPRSRSPRPRSRCSRPGSATCSTNCFRPATDANARRCFKRKNDGFWRAQFCTEVARPERFERPTLRFVV